MNKNHTGFPYRINLSIVIQGYYNGLRGLIGSHRYEGALYGKRAQRIYQINQKIPKGQVTINVLLGDSRRCKLRSIENICSVLVAPTAKIKIKIGNGIKNNNW